jgi:NAD(P)-dependent dehydrogenase (short-subunit alcohol dehydrogenase family)
MARLNGKTAIVSGAGGGIGRAHALLLAQEGANVVVNDIGIRSGADAASVVDEIRQAGGCAVASTVSADWLGAERIVAYAMAQFGSIDIIVNNAGAGEMNDLWRFTEAQWDNTYNVEPKGYFAMIRAATPHMARQGGGCIVNTSSGSGFGHPGSIAHASSREGVIGLTQTVAKEVGRFGIRCNAIRPFAAGVSTTDFAEASRPWEQLMALTMGPVPGEMMNFAFDAEQFPPRKIAPFVVWLCTDAAKNVNGRTFDLHGDTVSLLSEPHAELVIHRNGGWDLDGLDAEAPGGLTSELSNPYTLDAYPELKTFKE